MARVSALFKAVIDLGGDAVDNLRSLGYLTEESAQNPSAVKTAQTKYRKALTESPAMRRREAERLGVSQFEDADLGPERIIQPEGLLGSTLIPVFGDKTVTGRTITAQRGRLLDTPVESHGGSRFAQQQQGTGRGYMSMETAAKNKQKNVDFAAERTGSDDIVGVFTAGADPSYQFAAPMADLMFKQTMDAGVPKAALREFDKTLRQVRPDWVGMESPDALAQLLGTGDYPMEGAGALRIAFTEEMSKARWRDQGFGVPKDAIEVITEPGLLGAARGDSGLAMINMRPGAETIKAPGLHQSYNTIIQGDYAGGLGRSLPAPIMFPDTFAWMQRQGRSPSSQLGSLMMDPKLYQKADENWLTGILDYVAKNPTALSAAGAAGLLGAVAPEEAEASKAKLAARGYGLVQDVQNPEINESLFSVVNAQNEEVARAHMADAEVFDNALNALDMEVLPPYRGRGIMNETYDAIEEVTGKPVMPSPFLSDDGVRFWMKRNAPALQKMVDEDKFYDPDNFEKVARALQQGSADPRLLGGTALGTAGILGAIEAGERADNAMAFAPQSETLQQGLIEAAVQAHNEKVAAQKRELGVDYDPRYDYGMILPYKKDIVSGETSLAFPGIARDILGALIDLGNTPRTGVYNPNAILDAAL